MIDFISLNIMEFLKQILLKDYIDPKEAKIIMKKNFNNQKLSYDNIDFLINSSIILDKVDIIKQITYKYNFALNEKHLELACEWFCPRYQVKPYHMLLHILNSGVKLNKKCFNCIMDKYIENRIGDCSWLNRCQEYDDAKYYEFLCLLIKNGDKNIKNEKKRLEKYKNMPFAIYK
jgi:hypothetical protein